MVNYNASPDRARGVKETIEKMKECEGVRVVVIQGVSSGFFNCSLSRSLTEACEESRANRE